MIRLADVPRRCFDGIVPATIATCSVEGLPNVAVLSHVYLVDERHVALSRQFFNKTTKNVLSHPLGLVSIWDPINFDVYRLQVRYVRAETSGPLFQNMDLRIEAIASHTGMKGIFKLLAADVFEVESVEQSIAHLDPAPTTPHPDCSEELALEPLSQPPRERHELWVLQRLSQRINRATDLEDLLDGVLQDLHDDFGFAHGMVLIADEAGHRLFTVASHGYVENGVGSEARHGEGIIGTVAADRRILRVGRLNADLRYGQCVRSGFAADGQTPPGVEIPLPGLPHAESLVALPLLVGDRLVGVLVLESPDPSCFESWHEAFLGVLADQVAAGIDRLSDNLGPTTAGEDPPPVARPLRRRRKLVFYEADDAVFIDGEYLIRNVPGRILWRLLSDHDTSGRTEFSNRELRLDRTLGLPPLRDNLESRLVLLRKRLEQKCPDVRLVRVARGRFSLALDCEVELEVRR